MQERDDGDDPNDTPIQMGWIFNDLDDLLDFSSYMRKGLG